MPDKRFPTEDGRPTAAEPALEPATALTTARAPGRLSRFVARAFKAMAWVSGSLLAVMALAWCVLLWVILPRVGEWRTELAQQATKALGLKVEIRQVLGRADGLWPTLTLQDVRLLEADGRVALSLPTVEARLSLTTLSPQALLDGEVRLDRLTLVGPTLDIRRDAAGDIHIAGLQLPSKPSPGGGSAGLDWVLSQSRIEIRQGTVRWSDDWLRAPTLALGDVNLRVRNRPSLRGRVHELDVAATPPVAFGQRFELHGKVSQPLWLVGAASSSQAPNPALAAWTPWALIERLSHWGLDGTRPSDWQTWTGEVTATFPRVDVQRLRQHVRLPVEVNGGRGALKASLNLLSGRIASVGVAADLEAVRIKLGPDLRPLAFQRVAGELTAANDDDQASLAYRKLAFTLDDGVTWPASSASLVWRHAPWPQGWPAGAWADSLGGTVRADRLDLALLAALADRLPLAPQARTRLAELAPKGVVEGLSWQWDGPAADPRTYKLAGRVKGLTLAESPAEGRPGLAGADVTLSANEQGGKADVQIKQGWLALPGVFEVSRLDLDELGGKVTWAIQPGAAPDQPAQWRVDVKQARFANPDVAGQLDATWRTGTAPIARLPGVLALKGSFKRVEASRVWRYLPLTLGDAPREYVRLAIQGGRSEGATFEAEGDLNEFPFKDDVGGRFRVKVPLRDVALDYAPAGLTGSDDAQLRWPPFTALDGDLVFEGQRMLIHRGRARLGTVASGKFELVNVEGRIPDLGADDPVLTIGGQGEGPLQDVLSYLSASPLSSRLGSVLTKAQGQGRGAMQLALEIPLNRSAETRLKGEVNLKDKDRATLKLGGTIPPMTAVRGRITFTEALLNVSARARVWGQELAVEGQRNAEGLLRFTAQGTLTAEALRQAEEYPFVARLAPRLNGEAPVTVTVSAGGKQANGQAARPEVTVVANLKGVGATLPAPLNKSAQAAWPLKLTYRLEDDEGHADAVMVDLGSPQVTQATSATLPWLRVDLRRDTRGDTARLQRGVVNLVQPGLGGATALQGLPSKGMTVQVVAGALDLEAWQEALTAVLDLAPALSSGKGARPSGARPAGTQALDPQVDDSFVPDTIAISSTALSWRQRTLKDVSATVAHPASGVWRTQVESAQLAGQVEWLLDRSPASGGSSAGRFVARLSRLSVPPAEAKALEDQASAQMLGGEAASMPALDIVIDRFEWRGFDLGRIEVEAVNRQVSVSGGPPLPEWRMTRLRLANPDAQLDATGNWTALGAQSVGLAPGQRGKPRSAFSFTLDLQNSGALLNRLGMPQVLKGGKGKLTGQVSWLGAPLEPDTRSMSGDVKLQVNEGQFLKADPGMAKLLGVLSLQALPRRLLLDFRDIFQEGFAFDSIDGDAKITQGVATTRNLRMRGVQAIVLMEGQADLGKETQNLHVYVVPEINAGTASLAYAAINPVVGLGTFVAQMLLRKQMSEAITREFWVTGTWADPQVSKGSGPRLEPEPAPPRKP
jgi:uncharacterized protein (TIGR02099 family)